MSVVFYLIYLREEIIVDLHVFEIATYFFAEKYHVLIFIIFQTNSKRFGCFLIFLKSQLKRNFFEVQKLAICITRQNKSGNQVKIKINVDVEEMEAFKTVLYHAPAE